MIPFVCFVFQGEDRHHRHSHQDERSRSPHHRKVKKERDVSPVDDLPDARHRERRKHRHRDGHDDRHPHRRHIKQEVDSEEEQHNQRRERRANDDRRREARRRREADNPNMEEFGRPQQENSQDKNKPTEKEKPNFGLSGKLTEETNTYKGVVIKYNQPPEARKPKTRWRLYPFKGDESLPVLYIHRQSAYLLGRDRLVVDLPLDHPSCSKQHAVLQYRLVDFERDDGTMGRRVSPYIIDLGSANGTFVNNNKIEPQRYVQLLEKDMLKFGFSSREYVLLHEKSKTDPEDDEGSD